MSHCFESGGRMLWNPSLGPAHLYLAMAESVSAVLRVDSGIATNDSDESHIDPPVFEAFTRTVFAACFSTTHPEFRLLLRGPLVVSLALLEKLGVAIEPADAEQAAMVAEAHERGSGFSG
ncbi:hypothetical protein GT354_36940 [Streptomyces sp. SID3343]|nr:hypothetical protein [Streptomyces sp. SID3343]